MPNPIKSNQKRSYPFDGNENTGAAAASSSSQRTKRGNLGARDVRPVIYILGQSDVIKSSVNRALMQTSTPPLDLPQILKNTAGGLDSVIINGKHLRTVDFERCPPDMEPEVYAMHINNEKRREGSLVPQDEPEVVLAAVNCNIENALIPNEISRLVRIIRRLHPPRPWMLLLNRYQVEKRYEITWLAAQCDALFRNRYEGYLGAFSVCAAPLYKLDGQCPTTVGLPLRQRHGVELLAEGYVRVCLQCNSARVCSSGSELASVVPILNEIKRAAIPIGFTVFEPVELHAQDAAMITLQSLCFQGRIEAGVWQRPTKKRLSLVKSMFKDEYRRILAVPALVTALTKDLRSTIQGITAAEIYPQIIRTILDLIIDERTELHRKIYELEVQKMNMEGWFNDDPFMADSHQPVMAVQLIPQTMQTLARALYFAIRISAATYIAKKSPNLDEQGIDLAIATIESVMPQNGIHLINGLVGQNNTMLAYAVLALQVQRAKDALQKALTE